MKFVVNAVKHVHGAFYYSVAGLKACIKHEMAFRVELFLAVIMIPLGLWLGQTTVEKILLAGTVLLVLVIEVINSAIEAVVDRIGLEQHELSGRAKDQGSAAVFLASILAGFTWLMILFF